MKIALVLVMLLSALVLAFLSGERNAARYPQSISGVEVGGARQDAVGAAPRQAEAEILTILDRLSREEVDYLAVVVPPEDARESGATDTPQVTDIEWARFPRTNWDLAVHAVAFPQGIRARELYRHRQLNPRDIYLPREHRDMVDLLVKIEGQAARDIQAQLDLVRRSEIDQQIQNGNSTRVDPEVAQKPGALVQLLMKNDTDGAVLSKRKDQCYLTPRDGLGRSRELGPYARFAGQVYGAKLVSWFQTMGLCQEAEAMDLMKRLFEQEYIR